MARRFRERPRRDDDAERRPKRLRRGALPEVAVLDIVSLDADGDLIAVPTEWDSDADGPAPTILIHRGAHRDAGPAPGVGERVLARLKPARASETGGPGHVGRIIKALERARRREIGIYRVTPEGGRVESIDKRGPPRVWKVSERDAADAREGDIVAIEPLTNGRMGLPVARVAERFGGLGSERAVSELALISHGIPHVFPERVLSAAAAAVPVDLTGREDWRALPLVTIDPADAKDHDDAVHAAPDPDHPGGFVVTVAIADVAAYVTPGSALDAEAALRGNSVYFPDRVVPMLPERLSNDLCSLKPGVDRPAMAMRLRIAADGRTRGTSLHRVMMRSVAKLAYPQAQAAIDGRPDAVTAPLLDDVLKPLWAAWRIMDAARRERGPLDLDLPERKILLKPDGTVDRVIVPERLEAHRLIEEYMIRANVAAAELCEDKRVPLVYRIHDDPSAEKLIGLREVLKGLDLSLPKQGNIRPAQFNLILARVKDTPVEALVNEVVLRAQAQAAYDPENIGHFGLALRRYAHFTSPIRRYADLIVHRALIRAYALGTDGLSDGEISRLKMTAKEISAAERRAMAAERDTGDRLIAAFLASRIGASFSGRISGVVGAGLFVRLDDTGADGFVPVASLGGEYWVYDEAGHAIVGSRSGTTFRLGDPVEVRLSDARPVQGALRFEMLSEGLSGRPLSRGPRGRFPRAEAPNRAVRRRR